MMKSSNGNIFCVTGHLCGEFTCPRWIPITKASDAELWCFLWSAPEQTFESTIVRLVTWEASAPIMTRFGSGIGSVPVRRQAITKNTAVKYCHTVKRVFKNKIFEFQSKYKHFYYGKYIQMSSVKWWQFSPGLDVIKPCIQCHCNKGGTHTW